MLDCQTITVFSSVHSLLLIELSTADMSRNDTSAKHYCSLSKHTFLVQSPLVSESSSCNVLANHFNLLRIDNINNAAQPQPTKKDCQKAERRWRKTQLHIDYNKSLKQVRDVFSTLIDTHKNNPKHNLSTIDQLLILSQPPNAMNSHHCIPKTQYP